MRPEEFNFKKRDPTDGDSAKTDPLHCDTSGMEGVSEDGTGLDGTGLDGAGLDGTGLDGTGLHGMGDHRVDGTADRSPNALAPEWFDRLVDGELDERQERSLIARIEQTPDGWRHCALAFLEARVWRRELSSVADRPGPEERPIGHSIPGETEASGSRTSRSSSGRSDSTGSGESAEGRSGHWPTALAVAALLLLAFGLGSYLDPLDHGAGPAAAPKLAGGPASEARPTTSERRRMLRPELPAESALSAGRTTTMPVANLMMDAGQGKPISVPVFDWDETVGDRLTQPTRVLPAGMLDRLKRHEVRRRQRYVPVQLEDGRHIVVPLEEVDIVPVRTTAY